MGYVYLLLSLIAGAAKGFCGKKTSGYVNEYKDAMLANSIRMIFCILIGFLMILFGEGVGKLSVDLPILLITLLSGAANSAFVVLWLVSVKRGAYMMLDVFCMMGILIPLIGCAVLFNETIALNHIIGILILTAAVYIMCSYNNSIKSKMTLPSFVLLVFCGITNGLSDFSQKLFVNISHNVPIAVFNFYTYLFSAIILVICYFIFAKKSHSSKKTEIKPIFMYILIMSVCLFAYSYFKTLAAGHLPSAQLYPLAQGGALILSSVMSAVFFRERLNKKCVFGISLSFIALIIINVL